MKRVFTWLNNSLEEFLMGAGLIMMTADYGNSGGFSICIWHVFVMVGRDHKIYFYLGRILSISYCTKMYFYKKWSSLWRCFRNEEKRCLSW
mgnify:CR=1 FL=1